MSKTEIEISDLKPTNDYIFKRVMGRKENINITQNFLNNFVKLKDIKINEIKEDKILVKQLYTDKVGILDILAVGENNEQINLEMQVGNYDYIQNRLIFYISKLITTESIEKGEKYETLKKTIVILIANDELNFIKEIPKYHTIWKVRENEYFKYILTDIFEIHIIELGKIKRMVKEGKINKYAREAVWEQFFREPRKLEEKMMADNEDVKEAKEKFEELLTDEEEARLAFQREIYLMDKRSGEAEMYNKGLKEGQKEKQVEIAKNLLNLGLQIKEISSVTGLNVEEIKNLAKSLN